MKIVTVKGWDLYFHPLFAQDYISLREKVFRLKQKLSPVEFNSHPDVKLYNSLFRLINDLIPTEPFAHYFVLRDGLKQYSRVKGKGLQDRQRLFFKVFKENSSIVILWLGYPRKEGARNDCYTVFSKFVERGEFPESFADLISIVEEFNMLQLNFSPPSLDPLDCDESGQHF